MIASVMTKVSVALLTYNHERYIAQALQSVLSQQLASAFEIVVGDDASTDGTREIISGFQRMHIDRLRTIFPDRNLGSLGASLPHGLGAVGRHAARGVRLQDRP